MLYVIVETKFVGSKPFEIVSHPRLVLQGNKSIVAVPHPTAEVGTWRFDLVEASIDELSMPYDWPRYRR